MFSIVIPSTARCLSIQRAENAWYWSGAVAGVLRKHGLIGIDASGITGVMTILTRGADATSVAATTGAACLEGPLTAELAGELGLRPEPLEAERLELLDDEGVPLGTLCYPACSVRPLPADRSARPAPTPFVSRLPIWNNRRIRLQACAPSGPWRPVARARLDANDEPVPVALSDGVRLVLTIPLLDLLVAAHAFAPLDDAYHASLDRGEPIGVESWLVRQLLTHARRGEIPTVRVGRWPAPWTSALTIRHDYDRPVAPGTLEDLLDFYEVRGLRSSWGFLAGHPHDEAARRVAARGHEVALHAEAPDELAFAAELDALATQTGVRAHGYTTHGGIGSAGFLGQHQHGWALRAGLAYGEALGRANRLPHPAFIAEPGTLPCAAPLVLPATHASLDTGTAPEAHRLDRLRSIVPALLDDGAHAVVMNHPDIHGAELRRLLDGLDLARTWRTTFREVARWTRAAKLDSRVTATPAGVEITFGERLPEPIVLTLTSAAGALRDVHCAAGEASVLAAWP